MNLQNHKKRIGFTLTVRVLSFCFKFYSIENTTQLCAEQTHKYQTLNQVLIVFFSF